MYDALGAMPFFHAVYQHQEAAKALTKEIEPMEFHPRNVSTEAALRADELFESLILKTRLPPAVSAANGIQCLGDLSHEWLEQYARRFWAIDRCGCLRSLRTAYIWQCVHTLMSRQYWKRRWVLQELHQARAGIMICGEHEMEMNEFHTAWRRGFGMAVNLGALF